MHGLHCSFAYSALACFRMGMSGSASFREGEEIFVGGESTDPKVVRDQGTRPLSTRSEV